MAEVASAYVSLIPTAKGFQSAIAKELGGVGGVGGSAGAALGDSVKGGFGKSLRGLAGVAAAAFGAVQLGGFLKNSINAASSLSAEFEGVNQVFGKSAASVQAFAKSAAYSAGVSETQALQAAKGFGVFASAAGLAGQDAADFSVNLVKAAGDLGSFNDVPIEETLASIKSALQGQGDAMSKYGIIMNDATLRQQALKDGLIATTSEALTPQQKVLAANSLIMGQLGVQTGDFVNYSSTYGNALKTLNAAYEGMVAQVGTALIPAMEKLLPAILPLVDKAMPILMNLVNALVPVILTLADSIGPLFDALTPLFDAFVALMPVIGSLIESLLPPLINIIGALAPIVLALVQAFAPMIEAVMPVFVTLLNSLMPLIEVLGQILVPVVQIVAALVPPFLNLILAMNPITNLILPALVELLKLVVPVLQFLAGVITKYVAPAIQWFADLLGAELKKEMELVTIAMQKLGEWLAPLWNVLKPILDGLAAFAGIKPSSLQKNVTVKTKLTGPDPSDLKLLKLDPSKKIAAPLSAITTGGGGGTGKSKADIKKQISAVIKDARSSIKDARKAYQADVADANKAFVKAQADITKRYDEAVTNAAKKRDADMKKALVDYETNVAKINSDTSKKLADIIQSSMDRLRDAFKSVAEVNVGAIFSSDSVNKKVDGLLESLRTKLTQSRLLIEKSAALAAAGYSQTFIEQVVALGGEVGVQMADSLLKASPDQQREIKDLFGIIETEANHGMDSLAKTLYDKNGLATEELKNGYAQTLADQATALAEQKAQYDQTVLDINAEFRDSLAQAASDRDAAMIEAQASLTESLTSASTKFTDSMTKIAETFKDKVAQFKADAKLMAAEIATTNKMLSGGKVAVVNTGKPMPAMANGGLVTKPTTALIGEAGPELVIPLDKFQSIVDAQGSGKTLNYFAAPNQSVDSEQALFEAMRRSKVVTAW